MRYSGNNINTVCLDFSIDSRDFSKGSHLLTQLYEKCWLSTSVEASGISA